MRISVMEEKKKKKKKTGSRSRKLLLLLLTILSIPLILIGLSVGFLINLSLFAEKFLERRLTFSELHIDVLKARVEYKGISYGYLEGEDLFTCNRLFFDIDVKKTLLLNPTISSISIEEPRTFIIKDKNNRFSLPDYFEKKEGFSFPLQRILFLPFNIEQVNLTEGAIFLQSVQGDEEILTGLKIFLPGFSTVKKEAGITPEISGRINGKKFEFKGETEITPEYVKNSFTLSVQYLDLTGIASFIPPVLGSVIKSGVATTDLNLVFTSYSAKKPTFYINGTVYFNRFTLYNNPGDYFPITNGAGKVEIANYDVFNRALSLKMLYFQKGQITYEVNPAPRTAPGGFRFYAEKCIAENISLFYKNPGRTMDYRFTGTNLALEKVNNSGQSIGFGFTGFLKRSSVECRGVYLKDDITLDLIDIENMDPVNGGLHFKIPDYIKKLQINRIKGKGTLKEKKLVFNGQVKIGTISIKKENSLVEGAGIILDIASYHAASKELFLTSAGCTNLAYWYKKTFGLYNVKFLLEKQEKPYYVHFQKDFSFDSQISLSNLGGSCVYKKTDFDFSGEKLVLKTPFTFLAPDPVLTGGELGLTDFVISKKKSALLKIKELDLGIKKISFKPVKINLSTVKLKNFFAVIDRYKDNSINYLGLVPAGGDGKDKDPVLNIDSLTGQEGIISYRDYLIKDRSSGRGYFKTDIQNIHFEAEQYPSFVYPQGTFSVTGSFGTDDRIAARGIIGKRKLEGTLTIKDLYLLKFSPLFEQFLAHKVVNGRADLNMSFSRKLDDARLKCDVDFYNLDLHRVVGDSKLNLSIQVPLIEDEKGKLSLKDINIQWNMNNKKFKLAPVFFDIFIKMVSNIALPDFFDITGFQMDEEYRMISFVPGSAVARVDSSIGESLARAVSVENKVIVLEAYVDKKLDSAILKEKKLEEYKKYYREISTGDVTGAQILGMIYFEVTGTKTTLSSEEQLRQLILEKVDVPEEDYLSLAFSRLKSVRAELIARYGIDEKYIIIRENDIYRNPYISGISNNICIIRTGRK